MYGKSGRGIALGVTLIAMLAGICEATVVIQTGNYTYDAVPSMPADFGPPIAAEGVGGVLIVGSPEDGCSALDVPDHLDEGQPWIALLARTQGKYDECTFDVKVRHAENNSQVPQFLLSALFKCGLPPPSGPPSQN